MPRQASYAVPLIVVEEIAGNSLALTPSFPTPRPAHRYPRILESGEIDKPGADAVGDALWHRSTSSWGRIQRWAGQGAAVE